MYANLLEADFQGTISKVKREIKFRPCLLTYSTKSKELHRIKRDAPAARFVVHFFTLVLDDHARCETSRNLPVTRVIEEMLLSTFFSTAAHFQLFVVAASFSHFFFYQHYQCIKFSSTEISFHILISRSISFSVSEFHASRCRHLNLVESKTALLLLFFPSLKVRVATRFTAETRADCLKYKM